MVAVVVVALGASVLGATMMVVVAVVLVVAAVVVVMWLWLWLCCTGCNASGREGSHAGSHVD